VGKFKDVDSMVMMEMMQYVLSKRAMPVTKEGRKEWI
jgi:hypothetical protein